MKSINVLSLFDGISCGMETLNRLGIKVDKYYSSEIDKYAIEISSNNYPNIIQIGDVCEVKGVILEGLPKIDLILAGSPCFTAGHLVMTDKGYKNIEDIKIGDKVLTHKNKFEEVKNTFVKIANELYNIKIMGSENIECTENHPFYVRKRKFTKVNKKHVVKLNDPEWIKAKDLDKNCFVGVAINQKSKLPEWKGELTKCFDDENFWWMIGRYIGDGWTTSKNKVCICSAFNEINEIIEVVNKLNHKYNNLFHYSISKERTTYKLQMRNYELYCYLNQFGKYAYGKRFTNDIFDLPINLLKSFLNGYISADGYINNKKKITKISTVSKELAHGTVQCVMKAYNIPCRLYKYIKPKKYKIEGRIVNQRDLYEVEWLNEYNESKRYAYYEHGYMWMPIRKIDIYKENTLVYNMEVNEDNSYTVNNLIVHNCQGFSRAGSGLNFEHKESKLFFEFIRVLNWIKENNNPDVMFLLENVEMKKEWRDIITEFVGVEPLLINSRLVSAQNRPRLYWTNICQLKEPEDKNITLKDILDNHDYGNLICHQGIFVDKTFNESELNLINVVNGEVRISQATKLGYIVAEDGDGVNLSFPKSKTRRGRVIKQKSGTLDRQCNICVYSEGVLRRLNINEIERLQGLPDDYTLGVSENKRKAAIGNAWQIDTIEYILKNLK